MIKELLEKVSNTEVKENSNEYTTFEEMMKAIIKKLKLNVVYENYNDSYVRFERNGNEYVITQEWEGMQYVIKLLDDEGVKLAELPQKRFMTKDAWYFPEFVIGLIEDFCD